MSLVDMVLSEGTGIHQLGSRFGLDSRQTAAALQQLLPALAEGLRRNLSEGRFVEDPDHGISDRLLGGPDGSRRVAGEASRQTGISTEILQQMLPLAAAILVGALSKQSAMLASGSGDPLPEHGLIDILTPMLDGKREKAEGGVGIFGRYAGGS